jgi:hypothetical protein
MIAVLPAKPYWTIVVRALGGFRKSANEPNSGFPACWSGFLQEKSQDQCHDDSVKLTDPPALAFASNIAGSDAPTVAYATVYPLTTLLRILSAQVLTIVLFR